MKELRGTVQKQKQKINELQNQLSEHRFLINELRRETSLLKVNRSFQLLKTWPLLIPTGFPVKF